MSLSYFPQKNGRTFTKRIKLHTNIVMVMILILTYWKQMTAQQSNVYFEL